MFFPLFSVKNGLSAQKSVPLFLVLCFVAGALLFSGCVDPAEDAANLVGTWTNVSGGYTTTITITSNTVEYSGNYKATIANAPNFEASSGILIIKFTEYATWSETGSTLSADHANVGRYGALYWKDLTASSVSLADAYKKVNPTDEWPSHTIVATMQEAQAAFTIDTVADYIDWSITSPYAR